LLDFTRATMRILGIVSLATLPLILVTPSAIAMTLGLLALETFIFILHFAVIALFFVRFSLKQLMVGIIGLNACVACVVSHQVLLVIIGIITSILAGSLFCIWVITFDPQFEEII